MAGTDADRTGVVTRARSRLGRAIALAFAGAGARVAALDRDSEGMAQTAAQVEAAGSRAVAFPVDVADAGALQAAAADVESQLGACHVVCANVGVQQFGALDRLTEDD